MTLSRRSRSSSTEGSSVIAGCPSLPLRGPPPHEWGGKHCLRSRTKASLAPPQGGGVPPQGARGLGAASWGPLPSSRGTWGAAPRAGGARPRGFGSGGGGKGPGGNKTAPRRDLEAEHPLDRLYNVGLDPLGDARDHRGRADLE